ncbi:drug resistance transporter, EmrB/QacA subfamily [Sinosporangium album]|uniref:Drug resistance transporter, EmrB/QacA subfamily n=1 Tax=Sinosporangium album TaxID=504805 RepID=A0A1G7R9S7_9ACTN|nr:MDR family MFS transporter [Sinosporangium album]SDG07528.1 drug resistance transporter, EmrB/QacA subfamily [Sinosporangium album]
MLAGPQVKVETETRPQFTPKQVRRILAALMLGMLTSMVSTSVVATALPTIVGTLGGQEHLAWVASAALLTMTASMPVWGKLSDLYGRKRMFQVAILLFTTASLAAGFAQDMGQLVVARAVQGIGVGGLQVLPQVVLGDVVEPRERGRYSGYIGAVFGVSTVAGPLIGGFVVDHLSWHWCFWVSVPLALVAFGVIQYVLRLPPARRQAKIDWWGAAFITGAATSVMMLLSLGGSAFPWHSWWTYGLAALTVAMLVGAVLVERRASEPILPPRLFRNRTFVLASAASLLVGMALFGSLMFLPQFLQIVHGMSPTQSGLMTLPLVGGMFGASLTTGRLVTRTGRWKVFPLFGMLTVAIGLFLLSTMQVHTPLVVVGGCMAVLGVGLGASMQTLVLAAQNAARREDMAVSTTGVAFFRALGGSIGVAAFGAILSSRLAVELASLSKAAHLPLGEGEGISLGSPEAIRLLPPPVIEVVLESFTRAVHTAFLVGVPVVVLGAFAVMALKELPLRSAKAK